MLGILLYPISRLVYPSLMPIFLSNTVTAPPKTPFWRSRPRVASVDLDQYGRHGIGLLLLCCLSAFGCGQPESPIVPLLTTCNVPADSLELPIGIGKDVFQGVNDINEALIVGGYQGGHHLWGAVRLPNTTSPIAVKRLHMFVCLRDEPVANALYDSVLGLQIRDQDIYGVPIVFTAPTDVWTLGETDVSLVMAVDTHNGLYGGKGAVTLSCCGHVADGD